MRLNPAGIVPSPEEIMQQEQAKCHRRWVEEEGGIEGPTHMETYRQECQEKRVRWVVERCRGTRSILEVGCNYGYILDRVDGAAGIDINPANIALAVERFPNRLFMCADITQGPWGVDTYDIVLLLDILEHLPWGKVKFVLEEAMRVARWKVLITLPLEEKKAMNFKHCWVPTWQKVRQIMNMIPSATVRSNKDFIYLEVLK